MRQSGVCDACYLLRSGPAQYSADGHIEQSPSYLAIKKRRGTMYPGFWAFCLFLPHPQTLSSRGRIGSRVDLHF